MRARAHNTSEEAEWLECPRCRHPIERKGRKGDGHCPTCGLRLIPSARKTEIDAWRQLYGAPPRRLP
jgi:tRNA(Ile2) C34 agmatinyltransferase TiaS